mmetsp:Transcript_13978/g.39268  ORF Transcript_13978/g.39268 Transcript_13978/m.39268 type:complete len:94 (+) Transcript_13978:271-552(+)
MACHKYHTPVAAPFAGATHTGGSPVTRDAHQRNDTFTSSPQGRVWLRTSKMPKEKKSRRRVKKAAEGGYRPTHEGESSNTIAITVSTSNAYER